MQTNCNYTKIAKFANLNRVTVRRYFLGTKVKPSTARLIELAIAQMGMEKAAAETQSVPYGIANDSDTLPEVPAPGDTGETP